jgi:hypothetical protein
VVRAKIAMLDVPLQQVSVKPMPIARSHALPANFPQLARRLAAKVVRLASLCRAVAKVAVYLAQPANTRRLQVVRHAPFVQEAHFLHQ